MQTETDSAQQSELTKEEVKSFYKQDLPRMIETFFSEPINVTYSLFANRSNKAYLHSLILLVSTGLIYFICIYLMLGRARDYMPFSKILMFGLTPVIFMLLVTALSFGIKSVSGKADFKNELLTGGLCGIPLVGLIVLSLLLKFFNDEELYFMIQRPTAILDSGLLFILLAFYLLLMLINVVQQSLKSSGTKDVISWYASPAVILVAFYITTKISGELF